jgi:hypothetical protein
MAGASRRGRKDARTGPHRPRRGWALQGAGVAVYLAALAADGPGAPPSAERALAERAVELAGALEQEVEGALARLYPLADPVADEQPPDWRSFARAVQNGAPAAPSGAPPGGGLFLWAPQVAGETRADYELHTGRDSFRSFHIREPDGRGELRPARRRAEHFPVHLVDPPAESRRLLGLDLLSQPAIAEAIGRARRSRSPQVLLSHALDLGPAGRRLVIVLPVARGPRLRGVLLAVLPRPAELERRDPRHLDQELAVRLAPWTPAPPAAGAPAGRPSARAPFYVRGQPWAVEIAALGR